MAWVNIFNDRKKTDDEEADTQPNKMLNKEK